MKIELNGESREVPDGSSVRQLIEWLRLAGQACAVEVNRDIVPKARHEEHRLRDGDRVEVVTLVGGG